MPVGETISKEEFDRRYGRADGGGVGETISAEEYARRYQPQPSVADAARGRLASRGLTPEMVKAGQTQGEGEMVPATMGENVKSFAVNAIGGAAGALASLPAMAMDYSLVGPAGAVTRMMGNEPSTPALDAVQDVKRSAVDFSKSLIGVRPEAITDTADAFGNTTGEIGSAFIPVPKVVREPVAGALDKLATRQYRGVFRPTGAANKELANDVVPELIKRGEIITDPKQFAGKMDEAAAAINVDDVVKQHSAPVPVDDMTARLRAAQDELYDAVPPASGVGPPARVPSGRSSDATAEDLQEYINILEQHAPGGTVDPQHLIKAKRMWWGETPADGTGRQAAGAVAKSLNAVPEVAAANAEKHFLLKAKTLGEAAPEVKPILTGTQPILAGLGYAAGGPAGAGTAVALHAGWRLMQHPLYKTASAVAKHKVAELIRNGHISEAEALLGATAQESNQNEYLQGLMRQ